MQPNVNRTTALEDQNIKAYRSAHTEHENFIITDKAIFTGVLISP